MSRGLGIRFAVEAVFLVAVAVGAVLADLSWPAIVVAMAVAWGIVSLVEWWASRPSPATRPAARPEPPRRREPAPSPPAPEVELPQHVRVIAPAAPAPTTVEAHVPTPPPPEPEPTPEPLPEPEPERPALVSVPAPPPQPEPQPEHEPEPEPEPQVVSLAARDARPREWNLWELERVARAQSGGDPLRDEERNYLLMYLRDFANADGALPVDFDGLVRDAFGDVLAAVGAP